MLFSGQITDYLYIRQLTSMDFIGRKLELEALNTLKNKQIASFVIVKGRRSIGAG